MWPPALDHVHWRAQDWHYIAEGGANVVVGYTGPAVWPFVDVHGSGASLALRIPKALPGGESTAGAAYTPPTDVFIDQVLSHILPRESLPVLQRIALTDHVRRFLQELAARMDQDRPANRRAQSHIHVSAPYMWAMRDYSRAPAPDSLVVEIKPKCGFLPQLSETAYPCKRHYSRYRMHRVYKALTKSGTSPTYSEFEQWYDPLDLFSGDTKRVRHAVS
ncbi:inositol-pentakisphosphate 2-kinase [Malassezia caprae]|uniref:Inositol-pentakisphosphate 2-kinase n=1 Tax=Malassezia caprae TaxID=1381934 RepID=A0AAF0IW84_9BASI|nr:inositol-pentakisphosphate 2-kinase [Malassezia caprae]